MRVAFYVAVTVLLTVIAACLVYFAIDVHARHRAAELELEARQQEQNLAAAQLVIKGTKEDLAELDQEISKVESSGPELISVPADQWGKMTPQQQAEIGQKNLQGSPAWRARRDAKLAEFRAKKVEFAKQIAEAQRTFDAAERRLNELHGR